MDLFSNMIAAFTWQNMVMMFVGGFLLYLSIQKNFEPTLLLPMGFGTILVNLPLSSAIDQMAGTEVVQGALSHDVQDGYSNRDTSSADPDSSRCHV